MNKYDVTVLIASYNPSWELLRKTVVSSLEQNSVKSQIIIADDGSKENYFSELKNLFEEYDFVDYKLEGLAENAGTVKNIYNGLLQSDGEYVKTISPGDYFFDNNTLFDWVQFAREKEAKVVFGNVACYKQENEDIIPVSIERYPQNIDIYNGNYNYKSAYLNYLLLSDRIIGADFLTKTDITRDYIGRILGKIKYAEDMSFMIMCVEGIEFFHLDRNVVWYECASGISTGNSDKWGKILRDEEITMFRYVSEIIKIKDFDSFRLKLVVKYILRTKINFMKYIVFPELIKIKLYKNRIKAMTSLESDLSYINEL